jgi:hypothetical protein
VRVSGQPPSWGEVSVRIAGEHRDYEGQAVVTDAGVNVFNLRGNGPLTEVSRG